MEVKQLKECLSRVSGYYSDLEDAKNDCNDQVESAITLLVSESESLITKNDKKAIKKLGKAMAVDKVKVLEAELSSIADVIEASHE